MMAAPISTSTGSGLENSNGKVSADSRSRHAPACADLGVPARSARPRMRTSSINTRMPGDDAAISDAIAQRQAHSTCSTTKSE